MEKNLKDLLIEELHDLLSAENQIVEALPNVVAATNSKELKQTFTLHLKETKGQVQRLKQVFKLMKIKPESKFCKGTKGLIQELNDVLKEHKTKSSLRDAALISKAQRIEHYEIAGYGTARTYAKELKLSDVAKLLQETLDQEGHADKSLTKLAEGGLLSTGINLEANEEVTPKVKKKSPAAPKAKATQKKAAAPVKKAAPAKKAAPVKKKAPKAKK